MKLVPFRELFVFYISIKHILIKSKIPLRGFFLVVDDIWILQDDSAKIRMKPRDPRRVLHTNALQIPGSSGSEQFKTNISVTPTTQGAKGNQNVQKQEGEAEMKPVVPPDISLPFTKSLQNIANIVSVSQVSTTVPSVSQNVASQPVQTKSDSMDAKPVISHSDQQTGNSASLHVVAAASHSQNAWVDVEHLFEGYDEQQKAAIQRERTRRMDEQKKMFASRKLCLVLDLDHTLLNSAKAIIIIITIVIVLAF